MQSCATPPPLPPPARYYHPSLRKLTTLYTDDDVVTMFDEWRQWREEGHKASSSKDILVLYITREGQQQLLHREGSSRVSTPGSADRRASPVPSDGYVSDLGRPSTSDLATGTWWLGGIPRCRFVLSLPRHH